ncbi:MAG: metallophosphoesterase family protein [Candidatus Krumholzibacteriia bacterium]
MKVFACSDVHGNVRALQAVLGVYREERPREFLFLGDCVGYGAHPDGCIDMLCNLPRSRLILGNHDAALLDRHERGELSVFAAEAIDWSERMIECKYLDAMRRRFTMLHEGKNYCAVHSSPAHPEEWPYIFCEMDADTAFGARDFALCFVGHTHVPALYSFNKGELSIAEGMPIDLDPGDRYIVNPGSVGQPRDGDPRAACCVFDVDGGTITFHRCVYDAAAEAQDIFSAGLPRFLGERLLSGT